MKRVRAVATPAVVALVAALLPLGGSSAQTDRTVPPIRIKHIDPDQKMELDFRSVRRVSARLAGSAAPTRIGAKHAWLAYDDTQGVFLKDYRLRGKGRHIEVWVAADRDDVSRGIRFPEGDCRNDERVRITDRRVNYLVRQFDRNIYRKESRVFSVPPDRNGRRALLPRQIGGMPRGHFRGDGDNIVVLVDNVRDENFYDTNNSQNHPYIAGFFSTAFNDYTDRNVMTIDAYDWVHRTRANPPNEPVPGDLCANKTARPFLYEGTFAHEYQHLLESYEDGNEVTFIDEGLADWAQTLTGYVDPRVPITEIGSDSHIQCFLGYLGVQTDANPVPRDGGPENSLTAWGDQGDGEILCDYGAAYTLMEFLRDSYGRQVMTRLHRLNANGFRGIARAIALSGGTDDARETLHKWIAAVALDGVLDDGAVMHGGDPAWYQVGTLDASINWETVETFSTHGAPPNGADFVRLRAANGDFVTASDLRTLEFDGAEQLDAQPVEWVLDVTPPDHAANPALYSGEPAPNINRAIVEEVAVPAAAANLTFAHRYSMEEGYDYAYVEVSTDGGATWERLSNDRTVVEGGFNGESGCPLGSQGGDDCAARWVNESFDLGAYAGQTVLVAFRVVYDGGVEFPGWWIDDVAVGGEVISDGTDIVEWQTPTQINPVEVAGFTLQLVAYDDAHQNVYLARVPLGEGFTASLDQDTLQSMLGTDGTVVAAIVMYDEPTQRISQYAPYELTVNNILQPGGTATTP